MEEKMKRFQELSEQMELSADDYVELALLMLGIHYGLSDEDLLSTIKMDGNILDKHNALLCLILHIEQEQPSEDSNEEEDNLYPVDRLNEMLKNHFEKEQDSNEDYEYVATVILESNELSAAQIEQIRLAVKAKIPEKKILSMIRAGKTPMEMHKTIEFYKILTGQDKTEEPVKENFIEKAKKKIGRK